MKTWPAFRSYVDTILSNHSESMSELDIPDDWFKNIYEQSFIQYKFSALKKLNVGALTTKQLDQIFKLNIFPNLLEIKVTIGNFNEVGDFKEDDEQNVVQEEVGIVPKLLKLKTEIFPGQDINIILKMFPGLRELKITNSTEDPEFMKKFNNAHLPYLCKLKIMGGINDTIDVPFDFGNTARNFPNLEVLKVSYFKTEISDSDQQFEFPCLQKLEIENVVIDDETIKILAANLPDYIDLNKCLKKYPFRKSNS